MTIAERLASDEAFDPAQVDKIPSGSVFYETVAFTDADDGIESDDDLSGWIFPDGSALVVLSDWGQASEWYWFNDLTLAQEAGYAFLS